MSPEAQRCYAPDGQASTAAMPPAAAGAPAGPASPLLNLHDRTQFELKLRYAPSTEQKRARYRIETYLFVPRSFGLTPHTYGPDRFYADLHTWSRFSLPPLSFPELLEAANANSPLRRLEVLLRNFVPWSPARTAEVSRELRLVGCASGVALRRALGPLLRQSTAAAAAEHAVGECRKACAGVRGLLLALRACAPVLAEEPALRAACQSVQDHLQSSLEDQLTLLLDRLDRPDRSDPSDRLAGPRQGAAPPQVGAARSAIAALLVQAASWRLGRPEVSPNEDEGFFHRRSLRKKYMSSALFLENHKSPERKRTHVVSGLAAAVAMLFAAWAATLAQRLYDLESVAFTLTVVGSYVIKDRIKEWVKSYGLRKAKAWPWDYNLALSDPHSGQLAATGRETFGFAQAETLPDEIRDERAAHSLANGTHDLEGDVILRYAKEITLRTAPYAAFHGVHEVIRFNVARFLERTDDPVRTLRWFDVEQHTVTRVQCPRLYHLHVVTVWQELTGARAKRLESVRLVLDKTGIRRLLRRDSSAAP